MPGHDFYTSERACRCEQMKQMKRLRIRHYVGGLNVVAFANLDRNRV